jgi:hypothetical protein
VEIWRDVPNYEGLYQVSNIGRVKSIKRCGTKGGILKGVIHTGYKRVLLKKNGVGRSFCAHRLVAEVFLGNPAGKECVNHIDGNKTNNIAANLEWCTRSENQIHAYKIGLQKPNVNKSLEVRHEQTKIKIRQLDMNGNYIKTFGSIREAAKSMGMNDGTHISAVARGKRKQCGGFTWEY